MARILLVRHGDTDWNQVGRIQGQVDTSLSAKGLAQVRALAVRLAQIPIGAAYASDLRRAAETGQAILNGRAVTLVLAPELREFSYGAWEGLTYQDVELRYPAQYTDMQSRRLDFAPPAGESMNQLTDRVGGFLTRMRSGWADHPNDTVLLVAHGGSLRAAITCLLGFPRKAAWSLWLATASLSIIDVTRDNQVLRLLNDTSHLPGAD